MDNTQVKELLDKGAAALEAEISKTAGLEARLTEYDATIAALKEKVAMYERKEHCEKIANTMIEKGLISHSDFQTEVQKMASGREDLAVLEKVAEYLEVKVAGISLVGDGEGEDTPMTPDEKFERGISGVR